LVLYDSLQSKIENPKSNIAMALEKITRQPLAAQVADQLRTLIESGDYRVGQRLPTEPELMTQLGVGRSTVREAVQSLAHAGVLEVRQGCGTFVRALPCEAQALTRQLQVGHLVDIHEARMAVEVALARLAAMRRSDEDVQAMRAALAERERRRTAQSLNVAAFVEADLHFHLAIARASGNRVLAELYDLLTARLRPSLLAQVHAHGTSAELAQLHADLLAAVELGAADSAQRAAELLISENLAAAEPH
jgi:DNA-binding FadR family transcriptional regulator